MSGNSPEWADGFVTGVKTARNAVAALDVCPECVVDDALAVLDTLLEFCNSRVNENKP